MAKTKSLALTTTPLAITTQTYCSAVIVKEDESVTGWPTIALVLRKPSNTDDPNTFTAGKSIQFVAPAGTLFAPNMTLGYVATASGTTTGVQDEQ